MRDPPVRPCSALVQKLYPSPNHGERRGCAGPDSVILHYTGMQDAASALLWLANPLSQVSCHYLIFEDGRIFQMVPENRRAWHAGRSAWLGETDMNSRSIGIEIVHPGHDLTVEGPFPPPGPAYPAAQIDALIALLSDIVTRWNIPARRILAHSDIAPGRKIDPGEGFAWEKLAAAGLGLWPKGVPSPDAALPIRYQRHDEGMPIAALQSMLAAFGYGLEISGVYDQKTFDVIVAFQRHWRQARVDGVADGETLGLLRNML
jgi:N-acetylmuramoyl-L-alanine amidase